MNTTFKQYTWYNQNAKIDSPDTVHQILSLGKLEDIKAIKNLLGQQKLTRLFLQYPKKVYIKPILNFTKNYILKIKEPINERNYLQNTPRNLRSK